MATRRDQQEIAERLYLSPHTVKEHTSALYRKLNVRNRAEAVQRARAARAHAWLTPHSPPDPPVRGEPGP